jgi:general secretion pathway protein C
MSSARIASLLKDYGWGLNLVFIGLAAYFVAGAVNAVVARAIRVVPTVEDVAASQNVKPASMRPKVPLTTIANRNLFNVKREELNPKPAEDGTLTDTLSFDGKDLKPCTLGAVLSATLVSADYPEWSVAVLVSNTTHEPEVYSINSGSNQIADDATLVDIRYREVVVRRRDHFELCSTEGNVPPPVLTAAPAPSDDGGGEGVVKNSETNYTIAGAEIDKALGDMNEVATQARIVPSFQNGKANGFKLFSIKPNSIYQKIGLQNGDVISKINGYEMNSPDKALEIYAKLKDSQSIQIDLKRRGKDMNMNYTVQR